MKGGNENSYRLHETCQITYSGRNVNHKKMAQALPNRTAKTDQDKIEIIKAGTALKTSIEIASSTDCDIAEW